MSFSQYEPDHISASRLSTYGGGFGCPRKYMFRYVMNLQSRWTTSSLAIGIGIGNALRCPMMNGTTRTLADMIRSWDEYMNETWDDIDPEVEDRSAMVSKGKDMLRALSLAGVTTIQGLPEHRIEVDDMKCPETGETLPPLLAFLDFYDPVTHRVTEFKTGASLRQPSTHLLQLALYRFAATRHTEDGTPVPPQMRLIQVNRAKTPRVRSEDVLIPENMQDWIIRSAASMVRAIRAGHFPARPSFACSSCSYRRACQEKDYSGLIERER